MLFNSLPFFIFFPLVAGLFFALPQRFRWGLLLTASCGFYMYFIPKYILILAFTIVIDYFAGLLIEGASGLRRKWYLALSIVANAGVLVVFKYFNFLSDSLAAVASFAGWNYSLGTLALVLPVGLSFHTFQAMSYTIEVYRGRQPAERHFGIYALYVMFFPQLVAGPIERPQNLLVQFREVHRFDYERVTSGLRLMAWGLFKKTVVADRLALFVNPIYGHPADFDGPLLVAATVCFAFQIYCDFSGYSDIAIGSARVMGFRLMRNFDRPYHALSIAEFWRRWHISLSTWFRDYVYVSLGGNRVSVARWIANILFVFLISGLWHGANWTFVAWGGLHGFFLVFGHATAPARDRFWRAVGLDPNSGFRNLVRLFTTFCLVSLAWVFFRAESMSQAVSIIAGFGAGWGHLLQPGLLLAQVGPSLVAWLFLGAFGIVVMEIVEWWWARPDAHVTFLARPGWVRWGAYYGLLVMLLLLYAVEQTQFIYFQF